MFNFVEDIGWESEAQRRGLTLDPTTSIGYCAERNTYAARLACGGLLIWEDGVFFVETAAQAAAREKTHGAIVFP